MSKSVLLKIFLRTSGLSTSILPVDDPKNNLSAATSFGFTFKISSKLSFVPPNIKE